MARKAGNSNSTGANIGFEQKLWLAADKQRANMDAAECKHVVLRWLFLKYISDAFEERQGYVGQQTRTEGSEWFVQDEKQRKAVLSGVEHDARLALSPPSATRCCRSC